MAVLLCGCLHHGDRAVQQGISTLHPEVAAPNGRPRGSCPPVHSQCWWTLCARKGIELVWDTQKVVRDHTVIFTAVLTFAIKASTTKLCW